MSQNSEREMLMYAQLAAIAARRSQLMGRDRFLVLTGMAATRAAWPDVADRCRRLIAENAPRHLITHYASFAEALRDDDFAPFARQTERFCPVERAEHLLSQMQVSVPAPAADQSAGPLALSILRGL